MSFRLRTDREVLKNAITSIDSIISSLRKSKNVKSRKFDLKERFPPYKYAIVDLEGDPPKFFGFVLSNNVYQVFITNEKHLGQLYEVIWKILNYLVEFYIFTFSNHETRFFKRILPFKLNTGENTENKILFQLKLVNVQKRDFEGLVPALYSLDEHSYHDPLLRDSNKIELHFKKGNYYLILEHNKSCLLSTLKIIQKRYLKLHLF